MLRALENGVKEAKGHRLMTECFLCETWAVPLLHAVSWPLNLDELPTGEPDPRESDVRFGGGGGANHAIPTPICAK